MKALIKRLFYRLFDKFYYFELDVDNFNPLYKGAGENFEFRELTDSEDDLKRIRDYSSYRSRGFLDDKVDYYAISLDRLCRKDEFTGLVLLDRSTGEIAYLRWIQFSPNYSEMMRYMVDLRENDAYLIDSFTVPKYRSRGLHKFMMFRTADYCKSMNIKRIYGGVLYTNQYAINVMNQVGYRVKKTIYRLKYYAFSRKIKNLLKKI